MRSAVRDEAVVSESEDLLTTGEVAKILNSSRQHVVNLCNSGGLPHVTVGKHRRIRRRDVEMLRNRSLQLSRDQRRSLWLNTAVAGRLVADPAGVLNAASRNLEAMQTVHTRGQAAHWLAEWSKVLEGPTERVLEVLTSPTPWAREMRQNSPFSGVLSEDERTQVLLAFRGHEMSNERVRP